MVSRLYAEVGRVKSYKQNLDSNLLPVSCTICVPRWDEDFYQATMYLVEYAIESLRAGVGVNVHLDYFQSLHGIENSPKINYTLAPTHKNIKKWTGLPVSSGGYRIVDSISGEFGIVDALKQLIYGYSLVEPMSQTFNFSKLREEGNNNGKGMIASGPESFKFIFVQLQNFLEEPSMPNLLKLISSFNQEIRRGGTFKNGAITTSLPWYHALAYWYIKMDKSEHPWLKKSVSVTGDFLEDDVLAYMIEEGINDGSLWIEKILRNDGSYVMTRAEALSLEEWERIRHNVCREILITDGQTCTLGHVNYGQCFRPDMLEDAYVIGMNEILSTHLINAPGQHPSGLYMDRTEDMQVGLGIIGLANMLGMHQITYADFVAELKAFIDYNGEHISNLCNNLNWLMTDHCFIVGQETIVQLYVLHLVRGIIKAARMAKAAGMVRAFCVAPTSNSSFKHKDAKGKTTTPNISAPLGVTTERVSTTGSQEIVEYGIVETASQVGFKTYAELVNQVQRLFNLTDLAHSISFDIWADVDDEWLEWWNDSHIRATYYRVRVEQDFLDKSDAFAGRLQCACGG